VIRSNRAPYHTADQQIGELCGITTLRADIWYICT